MFALDLGIVSAQTPDACEQKLVSYMKAIKYWYHTEVQEERALSEDSVRHYNLALKAGLLECTNGHDWMDYPFEELKAEGMVIATSPDWKVRVFSWNREELAIAEYFENVFQYRLETGEVKSIDFNAQREMPEPGFWVSEIWQADLGGSTQYLCHTQGTYSATESYEGVKAYRIMGQSLAESGKLFKTEDGPSSAIGIFFNYFLLADREGRLEHLIEWDAKTNTIKVPLIGEEGEVELETHNWTWNGKMFVLKK